MKQKNKFILNYHIFAYKNF